MRRRLMASHNKANGTGLTVLVDQDGKPIVTPMEAYSSALEKRQEI